MHPEADALLDAIFDHPDDDTPRLVYADWLQEHGQENYARFIRLQCAAAREKLWSDEANRLWEEIGRVWNRLSGEWGLSLGTFDWIDAWHFARGFLRGGLEITPADFADYSANSWPEGVFVDVTIDIRKRDQIPEPTAVSLRGTARLHRLALRGLDGINVVSNILRGVFDRLRVLDLGAFLFQEEMYPDLFSAHLPQLRLLRLPLSPVPSHEIEQQLRERFGDALVIAD